MASTSATLPDIELEYASLPPCHRFKLDLGGGTGSRAARYVELITKLRTKCSEGGVVVAGVKEACGSGFPLVEVIITYELESLETRLLIEKSSVYIVGYWDEDHWDCFCDCRYKIDSRCKGSLYSRYESDCTKTLGFRPMLQALQDIKHSALHRRKKLLEVLIVHISEAVRFRHIEIQVFKGLIFSDQFEFPFVPDCNLCFQWYKDTLNREEVPEVRYLLAPNYLFNHLDFVPYLDEVKAFDKMDLLVKNWNKLSFIYVQYCITGVFDSVTESELMQQLRISGIETLKRCLGLLKKIDFEDMEKLFEKDLKKYAVVGLQSLRTLKGTRTAKKYEPSKK